MLFEISKLLGCVLEIVGVLMMANSYLNIKGTQIPIVLMSALWRGSKAKDAEAIKYISDDRVLDSL